ncbi:MAG: hypothetical protein NTX06_08855, partial [Proteobacteria bacterium]|nr:hypothetical protein [Pseudomonadota bacterium]
LFDCPRANAFIENKAQLSCSVYSPVELKKKYCQAHFKQDINPSPVLNSEHNLFSSSASNRLCMRAALPLVNTSAPIKTSMRLNL